MKRTLLMSMVGLAVLGLILSGCGGAATPTAPPQKAAEAPPAAKPQRLSIATGGTGGVYYPYGGGLAKILSANIKGVEATAEVTAASVDNVKLIKDGKADLALIMADVGYDAVQGAGQFKEVGKVPIRTLAVLYGNYMHVVALDGSGINSIADLKGKKVSTGAPGSGTEVKGTRVLEAYGIDAAKDIQRERLGVAESAAALKDRKIDAFFWDGGLPTAAVLDLAATPGIKIKLLSHEDAVKKMVEKYGPSYFPLKIPKGTYPNQDQDVVVAGVANLLIAHEKMDAQLAYDITKTLFDKKADLVAVHKEAEKLSPEAAVVGSPVEYHPGAIKYYTEKGVWKK